MIQGSMKILSTKIIIDPQTLILCFLMMDSYMMSYMVVLNIDCTFTELEKNGLSPDAILEEFHLEVEKDILQITSLPAEELKLAEDRRIQVNNIQ